MSIELTRANLLLKPQATALLKRSRGVRLTVLRGTAWITVDGEQRDIVLEPCQAFTVGSDADVVVSALMGSVEVAVRPPRSAAQSYDRVLPSLKLALAAIFARVRGALSAWGHSVMGVV